MSRSQTFPVLGFSRLFALFLACFLVAGVGWKLRKRILKRLRGSTTVEAPVFAGPVFAADKTPVRKGHPRVLLDREGVARLKQAARIQTPAWKQLRAMCDTQMRERLRSGYQGFDWGEAVADLSLCWYATGETGYAETAVRYLEALIEDKLVVGDHQGGETVVHGDSGYGIRSYAVHAALGYDWLFGAPSMTDELRTRVRTRLFQWLDWYRQKGYQREFPISNYFCGYLAAAGFSALAAAGETPQADRWVTYVREDLLAKKVLPQFAAKLAGGDFPEGWQYGELASANIALVLEAIRSATGKDLSRELPWLGQVVGHHVHALQPSGETVYDGGDWGERPAQPSSLGLRAISWVVRTSNPDRSAAARWMVAHVLPPLKREQLWIAMLAEQPGAPERDPRQGAATSLHIPGTGLSFFRSEWSGSAVWASFQAGPPLATDHQHADQGHFELWRGPDALLVDGGEYGSAATINHNSLLIDDSGRVLNYTPNQGLWGKNVRTTRFFDSGTIGFVAGDLTDAYLPACVDDGCGKRVARQVVRELAFVRPATLVIRDRIVLEEDTDSVVFAAHTTVEPVLKDSLASATIGASRVDLRTLLPAGRTWVVRKEPTATGDRPWTRNQPWGPMWRIEMGSIRGAKDRRFVHVISASAADAGPAASDPLSGAGLQGAHLTPAGSAADILFADQEKGGQTTLPGSSSKLFVAGLRPGGKYELRLAGAGAGCRLSIEQSGQGHRTASAGGTIELAVQNCQVR